MFIGRETELKRINSTLQLDSFKAVLVYGRRRVGKTELINQAIRECKNLVYLFWQEKQPLKLI